MSPDTLSMIDQPLVAEINRVLDRASTRLVDASPNLTTIRPTDSAGVACARRLVAAMVAIERDEHDEARAALADADGFAALIDGPVPARLQWFHEYIRGDVAACRGDPTTALEHLDRASEIATANRLDYEALRSSANAMFALRTMSRPTEVIDRLIRLSEARGRTSTDSVFYQIVADTLHWLGRPRTALRVRIVGMDRRSKSDSWWYRNHREIARGYVELGRLAQARATIDGAAHLGPSVEVRERLLTREVEMALLLAEGRPRAALDLVGAADRVRTLPRSAVYAAEAALQLGELDLAGAYLDQADLGTADDVIRVSWLETEARRLELVGEIEAATAIERQALELSIASRPPTAVVNALVARVEAWVNGEPAPSRSGRAEAMEGGLSDLRSALGTLMMLCDLGDLDSLAHAEASLAEVRVLIEALSIDRGDPVAESVDLHGLAATVLAQVEPIARTRRIVLTNAVAPGNRADVVRGLLEVALQGVCVVACTELNAGQTLLIAASATPLEVAIMIPRTTAEQQRQFLHWFETTVARGHHVAGSRHRLSVLGIALARLWTVGLFTSVSVVDGALQFRIASETSRQ